MDDELLAFPPETDPEVQKAAAREKAMKDHERRERLVMATRTHLAGLVAIGEAHGLGTIIYGVLKYAAQDIEYWKATGDVDVISKRFKDYTGKKIRGYLDTTLPSGLTVQQYIIEYLKGLPV